MKFSKELSHLNNNKAKVCIIGSGAAGLCAVRNFQKHKDKFEIEVFEKTNSVGGTWVYNENREKDEFGLPIHSSMYANLRTNIPLKVMEFPDFVCTKNSESFVSHQEVLFYLEEYAKDSNAHQFIKFYHMVKEVSRESNCWKVTIRNLKTNEEFTRYYDVVIVCVGRYSKPNIPRQSCDLDKFKGKILHSHNYRRPEEYENENICILGAGPSGLDISIELVNHAKKIYLLHKLDKNFLDLPNSIEQVNDVIKCADNRKVITKDGLELNDIDTIIFATGYEYDYDFLNNVGIKQQDNGKLTNVYLHMVNSLYPTMCLLAIPQRILPFPMYHQQLNWYLKYLLGELELPSKEEMDRIEEDDFKKRIEEGYKARHSHKMVTEDHLWDYEELICKQAKLPRINKAKRMCFNQLHKLRREYATSYKEWKYFEYSDTEFELKE